MSADAAKAACGRAAAAEVQAGMRLGLGSGSTAAAFVRALGARRDDLPGLRCAATSEATAALAREVGLAVEDVDDLTPLDLVVDGADEVDPELRLIKGGGAALLREKLVWEAARRRVVIADAGKLVARLGAFPLPVEIVPFAWRGTLARVREVLRASGLAEAGVSLRGGEERPLRTDQGNVILDLACGVIPDPEGLAAGLKAVTGVVEHGLFLGYADELVLADATGEVRRLPASAARNSPGRAVPLEIGGRP